MDRQVKSTKKGKQWLNMKVGKQREAVKLVLQMVGSSTSSLKRENPFILLHV